MSLPIKNNAQKFRDRHKGELAIICGCGPSLNEFELEDLPGVLFCINNSIVKFNNPDYWFAVDNLTRKEKCWDYILGAKEIIVTEELHSLLHDELTKVSKLYRDNQSIWINPNAPKLIMGADAIQSCVHLAFIMGFKAVALIGVDLHTQGGKKYFMDNPLGDIDTNSLDRSNDMWDKIMIYNQGMPIYNCSPNSSLRAVTKISLGALVKALNSNKQF